MISVLLSKLVLLVFGTLYPAYASYKTVKSKNVRGYVRWMMYWIVFALYTFVEIFADIFLAFWFPFYYELKILFVIWLTCPATKGSTYVFRKVLNPYLSKHEKVLDSYIDSVWDHGYDFARNLSSQGSTKLFEILMSLLNKGQVYFESNLPKISEIAQANPVMPSETVDNANFPRDLDEMLMDDEFDISMVETSSSTPETYGLRSRRLSNINYEEASDSTSEEHPSTSESTNIAKGKTRAQRRRKK